MKQSAIIILTGLLVFTLNLASVSAQQVLIESVVKGCEKEITGHCEDVLAGQGRILACLYAHSDKLSNKCEYALYDAAVQLERAVSALTYTASECSDDLEQFCMEVAPGEGRLMDCLEQNKSSISGRCKDALQVVFGFK